MDNAYVKEIIDFLNKDCDKRGSMKSRLPADPEDQLNQNLAATAESAYIYLRCTKKYRFKSSDLYDYLGTMARCAILGKTIDYNTVKCTELKMSGTPDAYYFAEDVRIKERDPFYEDGTQLLTCMTAFISELEDKDGFVDLLGFLCDASRLLRDLY